ncbi:Cmx/CmrA family chloramphenicol efflux MFS transporter [Nonomuraea sp. NPDC047897]|uniref:Cmx/CmrA family chloramphenicol efflux MFS transporter n=1 Tax=Nonomuraea sp. NPDC047897 TaxID=3364346 RepID=UPI00371A9051
MPFALYLLALAVFAQGTSEFMLSGLVPDIAHDMRVSVPAAGALTSAYAAGMVVGAPLMAVMALRWSRRRALLTFLVAFLLVHVVGAVTTSFAVLLATRAAGALAGSGFLAVAVATAAAMVPPDAKGRATSVLLGGVTVACVAGVPAGALLGQVWGWRSAFWAVALVCVPAVVAVVRSVPAGPAGGVPGGVTGSGARGEARALRDRRLLAVLLLGALVNGATFCAFTYLAPLVTAVTGLGAAAVPAALALFGAGSFVGVTVAGRLSDRRPGQVVAVGGAALLLGWVTLAVAAGNPVAALVLAFVQGALSFAVGSTLIARALYAAAGAPTLAGAFATAALNVGATVGPWAGGLAIGAGHGFRGPLWVSASLVAVALLLALVSRPSSRAAASGALPPRRTGADRAPRPHA